MHRRCRVSREGGRCTLKPFSSRHCFSHIWQYHRSFWRPFALMRLAMALGVRKPPLFPIFFLQSCSTCWFDYFLFIVGFISFISFSETFLFSNGMSSSPTRGSRVVGDGDVHAVRAQRHGGYGHHARSLDKAHCKAKGRVLHIKWLVFDFYETVFIKESGMSRKVPSKWRTMAASRTRASIIAKLRPTQLFWFGFSRSWQTHTHTHTQHIARSNTF